MLSASIFEKKSPCPRIPRCINGNSTIWPWAARLTKKKENNIAGPQKVSRVSTFVRWMEGFFFSFALFCVESRVVVSRPAEGNRPLTFHDGHEVEGRISFQYLARQHSNRFFVTLQFISFVPFFRSIWNEGEKMFQLQ